MSGSIVCGVDDSQCARRAAAFAAGLCDRLRLRLVLAHVAQRPVAAGSPGADLARPALEPGEDELALAGARHLLDHVVTAECLGKAVARVELGDPAEGLLRVAEEENATMIAVGSRGRGAVKTAVFGSVSSAVAARAPCPVLVVSEEARGERGHDLGATVVCGIDESENARQALRFALRLSERLGMRLVLAYVAPPPFVPGASTVPGAGARVREFEIQFRSRLLARLAAAERAGTHLERRVAFGRPAEELAKVALGEGARLLIVGCRGRGVRRGALMGSVSRELAGRAPCPVVIVPPPAARAGIEQLGKVIRPGSTAPRT